VRDGKPYPPRELEEVEIIPGVPEAIAALRSLGLVLIAVTNQPDVARGTVSRESVDAINRYIKDALSLDEIMTCFHDDADGCGCRKPRPGHFFEARERLALDLARSFMVGDRWRDVQAAHNAGCRSIFVDYGYSEPFSAAPPDFTCRSLWEAANWISGTRSDRRGHG
jgi:D-glycero-D-manno-heptose 1,7-bisphosphate phosphatase